MITLKKTGGSIKIYKQNFALIFFSFNTIMVPVNPHGKENTKGSRSLNPD
jgi:hypothetical protein